MVPRFNNSDVNAVKETEFPVVYYWYDPDDATAPTAISTALDSSGCRILDVTSPTEIFFVPKPQFRVTGTNTGYAQMDRTNFWINCANPDAVHYGLKVAYQSGGTTGDSNYIDITFHYYLQFKFGQ